VTGLSQKYGAVNSHVRISPSPDMLHATRIGAREADTLIGCDLVVAAGAEAIAALAPERSRATVCADVVPTSDFARDPDWTLDDRGISERLTGLLGDRVRFIDGLRLSRALLGDPLASNMMMLGAAWQAGQVPLPRSAIERAIELNGVAVRMNQEAFTWGRRFVVDPAAVERIASMAASPGVQVVRWLPGDRQSTQAILEHRSEHLRVHTGAELVGRYRALVERVQAAETRLGLGEKLSAAVADNYHRLLAVKDEWEVARLYAAPEFRQSLERQFEGDYRLRFHVGAWPFSRRDKETGKTLKAEVGPWLMQAFRLMSALRGLRGTWLDPFRNNAERRLDARLVQAYERDIDALLRGLDRGNLPIAAKIASLPGKIRGYGRVKEANADTATAERDRLLLEWQRAVDDAQTPLAA
jgi:indolepyruvate ferredoxin oxidoreductase